MPTESAMLVDNMRQSRTSHASPVGLLSDDEDSGPWVRHRMQAKVKKAATPAACHAYERAPTQRHAVRTSRGRRTSSASCREQRSWSAGGGGCVGGRGVAISCD
jgi:hypothetical protein